MKAEELMIGDWYYWESEGKMYPYQVTAEDFVKGEIPNFQPVPLTEEILEKNGYSYNENREAWEQIPNDGFGICRDEDDNCFYFCLGIFDAFNRYSDITYHYITKVEYVHELQHVIRLCKIEKEIIL